MAEFYMVGGLPGSGKSTFCKQFKEFYPDTEIVSTDAIRAEICGDESDQSQNSKVFMIAKDRIQSLLSDDKKVMFDATNLKERDRKKVLSWIEGINCWCACYFFNTPIEECIKRQDQRARKVPVEVIRRMAEFMTLPRASEGFDYVHIVQGDLKWNV